MKTRNTIFVLLIVLLTGSLFNTNSVIAQTGPNTNFKTGDNFYFNTTETRNDDWTFTSVLAERTNLSNISI